MKDIYQDIRNHQDLIKANISNAFEKGEDIGGGWKHLGRGVYHHSDYGEKNIGSMSNKKFKNMMKEDESGKGSGEDSLMKPLLHEYKRRGLKIKGE